MSANAVLTRCAWANPKNARYLRYHDEEWGVPCHDDRKLYEMLLLESFQAGLSWEIILNKREAFRSAFDGFDLDAVCSYDEAKLDALMQDPGIVRNRRKLDAAVSNSRIFRRMQQEFGSFDAFLWSFTEGKTLVETDPAVTTNALSDRVSAELKRRGMKFVGSTIIFSYLQAVGVIFSHSPDCFCYQRLARLQTAP